MMLARSLMTGLAVALGCFSASVSAQTAYPMLMSISPVAAQRGATSQHTIKSRYTLVGAYQVLVSGTGVHGTVVPAKDAPKPGAQGSARSVESLNVEFRVDADALPGVRDVRIATPHGVSTVGQLVVVSDAVIYEKEDNDKRESAQPFEHPLTLCGRIEKAEDVDSFRFHADAGTRLRFHVMCMRLQNRVHDLQQHADPILTIRDSNGSVIASSDNRFSGDPLIDHTFARAGDYWLEIRDVRYQGNAYWEYSIEVNQRPLVTSVYPLGLAAGSPAKVELLGSGPDQSGRNGNSTTSSTASVDLATASGFGLQTFALPVGEGQIHPQPLVVTQAAIVLEAAAGNDTPADAQRVNLPCGINGRSEREGDVDCYRFEAKKGERYSFEVFARRAGSALDSHLRILDEKGSQLQLSDDMRIGKRSHADSWIENWTVPADGAYIIEIRDLHLRGGADCVYFIEATPSKPYFSLFADTDKTPIAPGTTGVVYVRAEKKNGFDGEIQLVVSDLPAGITAHCGRILGGKAQDGCIVLEAAADAKPSVAPITISGWAVDGQAHGQPAEAQPTSAAGDTAAPADRLTATAAVYQEIYQPGGGRGHWPVESHVLAVTAPGDIRGLTVSAREIKLSPGGSATIDVQLERAEGFDKNVTLEATYSHLNTIYGSSLPEGVTIDAPQSNTLLTGGATAGKLVLKAAPTAPPVERQQIVVMANVSLNFVMKATYGSQPIFVSVGP